jgi:hypothetical protein
MHISFENEFHEEINNNSITKSFDYTKIYGDFEYVIEITNNSNEINIFTSTSPSFSFELLDEGLIKIKAYTRYAKIPNLTSNIYEQDYFSFFTI